MSTSATPTRQLINVNGNSLSEIVIGEGLPILMLHGWGASADLMLPLAKSLAPLGYQCLIPDLPGFGESAPPPEAWDTIQYAELMLAYLDAHSIQRAFLIGHSFGGRISLVLGADHADRVVKMGLFNSAGIPPRRSLSSRVRLTLYKAGRDWLAALGAKSISERLRSWYGNRYGSTDYQTAGALKETFLKVVNGDLSSYASRVSVPTLLLWGENDADTPLWQAETLKKLIPDAGLITFPDAGHYSYLEKPADSVRILHYFFSHDS